MQARIEAWLQRTYHLRNGRSCLRMGRMLRAFITPPELISNKLAAAASLPGRGAARVSACLSARGLVAWERRGYSRYWRRLPAAEDALVVVVGPPAPPLA